MLLVGGQNKPEADNVEELSKSRNLNYSYSLVVDNVGSVALEGRHAPHHEQALAQPVEWNPAGNEV